MDMLHFEGLLIGVCTFLIIGLFHPVVIKCESFQYVNRTGIAVENTFWSSLLGVFGFSSLWTIKELFEQKERVRKGWFPKNPKRKYED